MAFGSPSEIWKFRTDRVMEMVELWSRMLEVISRGLITLSGLAEGLCSCFTRSVRCTVGVAFDMTWLKGRR